MLERKEGIATTRVDGYDSEKIMNKINFFVFAKISKVSNYSVADFSFKSLHKKFMAQNIDLTQQIVADFAEGYSNFGLNPLMGRIVGLLIISKDPQSLDDIVEQLEMSKGPISQICRRLKERGLIEKVWIPGDRKDYYQAADDIFGKAYANQINKMQDNIEIAEKYLSMAQSMDSEDAEFIKQQMKVMKSFYELMDEYNKKFVEAWEEKHDELTE